MPVVQSFDLSLTASGHALAVGGILMESGVIPGKYSGVERLIYNRDAVCERIDRAKPDLVVFEDFSFASKGSAVHEIAGMAWMIRAELHADKIPYLLVAPQSLKKFCVGSAGSAKQKVGKELVIREVFRKWGHEVNDNNQADAIGLCYLGMAALGDWQVTINPQREVLGKIREKNPGMFKALSARPELPEVADPECFAWD